MLRLRNVPTLASVLVSSFVIAACSSTSGTGGGGTGGSYQGTGGTSGSAGSTSTGGTGGGMSTGGSAGSMSTGGTGGGMSTGGAAGNTSMDGGAGTSGTGGSGGKCSSPGTLHTNTIYCPFSGVDGGKNAYCTPGSQHCCEGLTNSDVSVCDPLSTACPSGWTDWVCQKDSDCGSGMQCCGTGTLVINTDPNCANYASQFHATKCETTCAANEIHMCTSNADCANGTTCTPFSTKGAQVGGCH